ncbi:SCO2584 family spore wall biosynthesis protein [Streptomyces sp. NPDC002537]
MPDDVGGQPFPDGEEPDKHRHGGADDPFASVVFDEEFVRSARIHEPTAAERMLAAAQARAEAEAARPRAGGGSADDDGPDFDAAPEGGFVAGSTGHHSGRASGWYSLAHDLDPDDAYGPYGRYGAARRPYRGHARWQRPVAWVLAVVMGIGVVALAFAAVYRSSSSGGRPSSDPPPATSGVDAPAADRPARLPSAPVDSEHPVATMAPRG